MSRIVAAITCLACFSSAAWAQQYPYPPPPPPPQYAPQYAQPYGQPNPEIMYRSGRRLRTVGMVLTFCGIGIGALGFALLYDARYNPHNDEIAQAFEEIFGITLAVTGIGCFIPGVVLWTTGSEKMDEALQMGASGMSLAPTPRVAAAPGLTWTIRF